MSVGKLFHLGVLIERNTTGKAYQIFITSDNFIKSTKWESFLLTRKVTLAESSDDAQSIKYIAPLIVIL
jgi:hypothetical protein